MRKEFLLMKRADLECIECRDVGYYEVEADYKCPKCGEGIITRWKETEPGYRCSGWYSCKNCGYDCEDIEG
jgi:predicted RNA-binding Zn-ribbon protein involved in translation (DUF1610 family)